MADKKSGLFPSLKSVFCARRVFLRKSITAVFQAYGTNCCFHAEISEEASRFWRSELTEDQIEFLHLELCEWCYFQLIENVR